MFWGNFNTFLLVVFFLTVVSHFYSSLFIIYFVLLFTVVFLTSTHYCHCLSFTFVLLCIVVLLFNVAPHFSAVFCIARFLYVAFLRFRRFNPFSSFLIYCRFLLAVVFPFDVVFTILSFLWVSFIVIKIIFFFNENIIESFVTVPPLLLLFPPRCRFR